MCFAEDSVEYATATCAMCAVMREVYNKPHTICPHVPAMGVCRNRANHPKADIVHYRNAEIKTYNGCGYCKVYFSFYFYRYTRVDRMCAVGRCTPRPLTQGALRQSRLAGMLFVSCSTLCNNFVLTRFSQVAHHPRASTCSTLIVLTGLLSATYTSLPA